MNRPAACFVTGTDTGVGKTRVSAGLLHWLKQQGVRAVGYKPVAAGMEWIAGQWTNEDVYALQAQSALGVSLEDVGPCQLEAACAPHIAAELEQRTIDRERLQQAARDLQRCADFVVAEGAGGWLVPLGSDWDSADLAQALGHPVLLVVGMRLGCLSHALLTAEAIRARGLPLLGWVANTLEVAMPHLQRNLGTLEHEMQRRHSASCLGVVPSLDAPDAAQVAACFNGPVLRARLGLPVA